MSDNKEDEAPAVTLTRGQLAALVRAAVRDELEHGRVDPEYLTAEEVGRMLGCAPQSVTKYVKRDGLPCIRVGNLRRFSRADVVAWLEERHSRPRSHKTRHITALHAVRDSKK